MNHPEATPAATITSSDPLTPALLGSLLGPQKPGESLTITGQIQHAAMFSRNRNGGSVKVEMDGGRYHVLTESAQMFRLMPDLPILGKFSLHWGYLAFNQALAEGKIRFV